MYFQGTHRRRKKEAERRKKEGKRKWKGKRGKEKETGKRKQAAYRGAQHLRRPVTRSVISRFPASPPPSHRLSNVSSRKLLRTLSPQALSNSTVPSSRTAASTSSSRRLHTFRLLSVLHLRIKMISSRWNLGIGPVVMVAGAFGAVLVATLANEFIYKKQEKVSEEKVKA